MIVYGLLCATIFTALAYGILYAMLRQVIASPLRFFHAACCWWVVSMVLASAAVVSTDERVGGFNIYQLCQLLGSLAIIYVFAYGKVVELPISTHVANKAFTLYWHESALRSNKTLLNIGVVGLCLGSLLTLLVAYLMGYGEYILVKHLVIFGALCIQVIAIDNFNWLVGYHREQIYRWLRLSGINVHKEPYPHDRRRHQ